MNSTSCKILTVFYPRIPITFSNVLDSLCAKERTCITMETKETLFAVVRWLVGDSPCGGRSISTSRKRSRVAVTSMTFTPPTQVQEPTKEAPKVRSKISRWLLELVGIQLPIVRRCSTEVGRMVVFWFSTRGKVRRLDQAWEKVWQTYLQKFHDMCAYQFEMGYDLAISPGCNVSRSPGFESVLGIYGGQE